MIKRNVVRRKKSSVKTAEILLPLSHTAQVKRRKKKIIHQLKSAIPVLHIIFKSQKS